MSVIEKRYWVEGIKEGEKREQERIIKLLEKEAQGDYKQLMLTPKLIALIKGEQNE
jgi:hypothetical protein